MEDKLILLVEDNPHIMAINDAALHMRGYRTLQAETAHKCRELLCFHAVDLIVLDILLPDGDGVALCREIKQEYADTESGRTDQRSQQVAFRFRRGGASSERAGHRPLCRQLWL